MSVEYNAVPWTHVEVGDDDRLLAFSGLVLPAGGPWRLAKIRFDEHPEAVLASIEVTNAPPVRNIFDDLPATKRLRSPLGRRSVIDGSRGRLAREEPVPVRESLDRHPWGEVDTRWPGVIVIAWCAAMFTGLGRVEIAEGAGGTQLTLWTWDAGGKLARENRITVVPTSAHRPDVVWSDPAA